MTVKEVNPHFEDFLFDWNQKFQLLVGGYGSSKSYHIALKLILKLLEEKRTV
ncbi:phage terminase large subunit, partial [Bacillus licheniformis]